MASTGLPGTVSAWSLLPSEIPEPTIAEWRPESGDVFIVDTSENMGYLVHPDDTRVSFPVITGQRNVVRYIGRVYDATTPTRSWTALSKETKGDRITFGKDGTFFRLTNNTTEEKTPYGIHGHAYADKMFSGATRYRSMGCIIVSDEILAVIGETFRMNGDRLPVLTTFGLKQDIASLRDGLIKSAGDTNMTAYGATL